MILFSSFPILHRFDLYFSRSSYRPLFLMQSIWCVTVWGESNCYIYKWKIPSTYFDNGGRFKERGSVPGLFGIHCCVLGSSMYKLPYVTTTSHHSVSVSRGYECNKTHILKDVEECKRFYFIKKNQQGLKGSVQWHSSANIVTKWH